MCKKTLLALSAAALMAATPAVAKKAKLDGKWVAGDADIHSYVTDGTYPTA